MNWIRNKSWLVLTAMLLLAATTIVLGRGQAAAPDPSFPARTAYLSSAHLDHENAGPAVDPHHGNAPSDGAHAADMIGDLPCNAACSAGPSGCGPAPLASYAETFLQRDVGTVCIRHRDDLMLSGLDPDAQLKPPKSIA